MLTKTSRKILIRRLAANDCKVIAEAFARQNWNKPAVQYENYLKEQAEDKREVLIAELEKEFAGYLTIVRHLITLRLLRKIFPK